MPAVALLTSLEVLSLLRDVALIAFLGLAFLVVFLFTVFGLLLYRRLSRVLERTERALEHTEIAAGAIAEGLGTVAQWAAALNVFSLIGRLFGRGGGSQRPG